jgi:hypothetical protein
LGWVVGNIESTIIFLLMAAAAAIYNRFVKKNEEETPPSTPFRPRPGSQRPLGAPPRPVQPPSEEVPSPTAHDAMTQALRQLLDLPPAAPPSPRPIQPDYSPPLAAPLSRLDDRVEADEAAPARAALAYAERREASARALETEVGEEMAAVVPTPAVLSRGLLQPPTAAARNPQLMASLRDRDSLRRLVVASAILGPPKALGGGERDWS